MGNSTLQRALRLPRAQIARLLQRRQRLIDARNGELVRRDVEVVDGVVDELSARARARAVSAYAALLIFCSCSCSCCSCCPVILSLEDGTHGRGVLGEQHRSRWRCIYVSVLCSWTLCGILSRCYYLFT